VSRARSRLARSGGAFHIAAGGEPVRRDQITLRVCLSLPVVRRADAPALHCTQRFKCAPREAARRTACPRTAVLGQKKLLGADDIRRAIARLAHEVVEHNHGVESLVLVGLQTRGVPLARRLQERIREFEGATLPLACSTSRWYRDDVINGRRAR